MLTNKLQDKRQNGKKIYKLETTKIQTGYINSNIQIDMNQIHMYHQTS